MAKYCMDAEVLKEIRQYPGNDKCVDCGTHGPQWASVSYGTLMCLDCSGRHRSLGVHLSFVRSVQMDSWNDRQVASMRLGGNAQLNAFLAQFGVADLPIEQKYRTAAAALYREQIRARRDNEPVPEDVSEFESEAEWPPRASGPSTFASSSSEAPPPAARGVGSHGPRMTAPVDPFEEEAERVRRAASDAWSAVSSAVWSGAQQVTASGRELSSRVAESGWTEAVSQRVSHFGTSLREADLVNRVQSGTADWFSKAASATSSIWNSATEPMWTWMDEEGNRHARPAGAATVPVHGANPEATGVSAGAAPVPNASAPSRHRSGVAPSAASAPTARVRLGNAVGNETNRRHSGRGTASPSAPPPVAASTLEGFDWDMAWGDESDGDEDRPSVSATKESTPAPAGKAPARPGENETAGEATASDPDPTAFDDWDDFDEALNAQLAEIDLGESTVGESSPPAAPSSQPPNTTPSAAPSSPARGDAGDDLFASVGLKP